MGNILDKYTKNQNIELERVARGVVNEMREWLEGKAIGAKDVLDLIYELEEALDG